MGNNIRIKNFLIGAACGLITILTVSAFVVGLLSDGFRNWSNFRPIPERNTSDGNDGRITDGDGNELKSGKTYPMPKEMIFTSASASSENPAGVTLTATITPDTATDKSVSWYVEWVNSDSEWATGKTATDYLTATPETDGSLNAVVACNAAFGEKIRVRVVSRDNPEATAECVVDFGQKVTSASLKIGEMNVDMAKAAFGTPTDIRWELNRNGVGPGGAIAVQTSTSEAYTLADEFVTAIRLEPSGKVSTPGSSLGDERYLQGGADFQANDTLTFDYTAFEKLHMFYMASRTKDYVFSDSTTEENIECFGRFIGIPYIKVRLTLTGQYGTYEFWGKINIAGYTNHATVTGVSLNSASLVV